ncbi:SDR family oxidoreductase [Oceanospirillaceae bacterium]|jgi:NAD(P)-dependent dehydrogenase (short-subunit alcohol dehydrogenase family)|nr:SDR family oxidoreductase [Oceanospirillaceae bacterium]MDC1352582.1 SDR family oxidoreductase [Oceanospirillaceae bacterium]MDC1507968.1 SDR family oxidoreductase [Oceanospirillaceae bacterium]|tara:strand:- start:12 stop:728 length:717 start_codon:yes stop_codon:yes gene_type:complete
MTHKFNNNKEKIVLISGGTSGIGLALAEGFATANYQVMAIGLGELPADNKCISFKQVDVRDMQQIKEIISQLPTIDLLINAAGILKRGAELEPDIFAQVIDVNLNGTMRCCNAAREKLALARGSIINIASMLSYFGGGLVPAYSASKGGVVQLTKSLAIAYAAEHIRVNAIAPGWIETPLTSGLRADPERNTEILKRTPMQRWGKTNELVGPALFLASDAASFITGSTLNVDGGYSAV